MVTETHSLFAGLAIALAGATIGCTSIPLDYIEPADAGGNQDVLTQDTFAEGRGDALTTDGASPDTGSAIPAEAGRDSASGPPCPCNTEMTGQYCCIPSGAQAPFCTADGMACTNANGIFVFCQSSDPTTQSVCCWNDGVGPGAAALYATSCGSRPSACAQTSNCSEGTCQTTVCGGVTIGACGTQPSCP
jgi:hypothetical protein